MLAATLPFTMTLKVTDHASGLRNTKLEVTYSIHTLALAKEIEYKTGLADRMHDIDV